MISSGGCVIARNTKGEIRTKTDNPGLASWARPMDSRQSLESLRGLLIVAVLLGWALAVGVGDASSCLSGGCERRPLLAFLLMSEATLLLGLLTVVTARSAVAGVQGRGPRTAR